MGYHRILAILALAGMLLGAAPERVIGPPRGPAQGISAPGFLDVGKPGAVHDPGARYRLPYDLKIPRYCSQGVGGRASHDKGWNRHSWDFALPLGTPILAARAGTVVGLIDRFEGPIEAQADTKANDLLIEHDDGTVASYVHLGRGIPVEVGEQVQEGQRIAYSGASGTNTGHLHFAVSVLPKPGERYRQTVPIRFARAGGRSFVPVEQRWYPEGFASRVPVRILIGDRVVPPNEVVSFRKGSGLQLRAERRSGPRWEDISEHDRTEWVSMTLWNVDVDERGHAKAKPAYGFAAVGQRHGFGSVVVFFGEPGDPDVGAGRIQFRVVE